MATILLSAAGAAIGSGFGGSVLGLSGAAIGRAVGATVGRSLDQRLLGSGSDAVPTGKVDRFRITGASYGSPIPEVWGRMRVGGEVIWASRFQERRQQSGSGKGVARNSTNTFSYSVSLAISLCKGEAHCLGRIWADGVEIAASSLDLRFYSGGEDQLPDPKIEAVEGPGLAPAYRGTCYVVIEDLPLARFGNRVPQFSFEVVRHAKRSEASELRDLSDVIRAVALIPGSGEYALATTPVHVSQGPGLNVSTNVHTVNPETDFAVSMRQLDDELPKCESVSLVVSWFGDDLRCGHCMVQPKVEQTITDGVEMPWAVSGVVRSAASIVPNEAGRAVYGGTPSDQSVIEAIQSIKASGKEVMFYPFILMDQIAGNSLPDPWSDADTQPPLPWRGRITLNKAPGQPGSSDQTSTANLELALFLGSAQRSDFTAVSNTIQYTGPMEWSYRRFILHYAHLCKLAGGVDAFCIGSELRGLTQIRNSATGFPFVDALINLAFEVRAILGSDTKISYAADWSEYFGYHPGSDVLFHLDPLWANPNIDFIGIDNYMPISDWRHEANHADAHWKSIYNLNYLISNAAGGEGFDWYYENEEAMLAQRRTPIRDEEYGEDWVFRYKDLKSWWSNEHFNRVGGTRQLSPTAWQPGSKPIVFTEYGCAALDLATNQPNKFLDAKSSESALPRGSLGDRDDYLQILYYIALDKFWSDATNNPSATAYSGRMLDIARSHAWAWDARPFPDFPANSEMWSDGPNYEKGHWLNGRSSNQQLRSVVKDICSPLASDLIDGDDLHGVVRGFQATTLESPRAKLQPLVSAFGVDVLETDGTMKFSNRVNLIVDEIGPSDLVHNGEIDFENSREPAVEAIGHTRITYFQAENDFETQIAEATFPEDVGDISVETELPLLLGAVEANRIVERHLIEARSSRDSLRASLPPSRLGLNVGSHLGFSGEQYRIDLIEDTGALRFEATRVDPLAYRRVPERGTNPVRPSASSSTPVFATFLDLPLLTGSEVPHAPHIAVAATPWPGQVSVWSSPVDSGYSLNTDVSSPAVVGETQTELAKAGSALWDFGSRLRVFVPSGELNSATAADVLNGANTFAIGDGTSGNWEVAQFRDALLLGNGIYELSGLLRGLGGTDATAPNLWPEGSTFVLLDRTIPQIDHPIALRGLERYYRIGQSSLGYTDPSVTLRLESFAGIGLRPLSVSHLRQTVQSSGDVVLTWIRRSRIDADSWRSFDIPLGEETESYLISVIKSSAVLRQVTVNTASWTYTAAMQGTDGITAPYSIAVAQLSASFGPGPETLTNIT